jgi:hypothetical protein
MRRVAVLRKFCKYSGDFIVLTLTSFPFGLDGVTPKTCVAEDKMSFREEFWLDEYIGFEIRVDWSYRLKAFARCRKVAVKTTKSMRRVIRALSFNFTRTFVLQLRKITKPQRMYLKVARHCSFCRLDCLDWSVDFQASSDFGQRSVGTSYPPNCRTRGFLALLNFESNSGSAL